MKQKSYRDLEKITKGVANHRRIQILELLQSSPNLPLYEISNQLGINFKTASEHVRRLTLAGLVEKKYANQSVLHKPTRQGVLILKFLRTLE